MSVERSGASHAMAWAFLVIMVPVLYVLSVGPMGALVGQPYNIRQLPNLYAPLSILRGTPLEEPLNAYIRWWAERHPR
jgi:hypothetical protein